MPLYFPRDEEEEDFALNELPDDIGMYSDLIFYEIQLRHADFDRPMSNWFDEGILCTALLERKEFSEIPPRLSTGSKHLTSFNKTTIVLCI